MENPFTTVLQAIEGLRQEVAALSRSIHDQEQADETGDVELAMQITGYARQTIYNKVMNRAIPHKKLGRKVVFSRQELEAWVAQHKRKTVQEIREEL